MRINVRKIILFCFASAVLIFIFTRPISYDLSDSAWSLPLSGKIIVLDPGHGGIDGGAVSRSGVVEKEITLAISIYLRDLLQESGALVRMTRESDTELATPEDRQLGRRKATDLKNRAHFINEGDADYLISIHLNSIPSPRWRGAQTFFHPQFRESRDLATLIQDELIRNLENTDRKAKMTQDLFILRTSEIPGVIVEVGFLSNPEESSMLDTVDYQKKVAASIYQGVLRFAAGEQLP